MHIFQEIGPGLGEALKPYFDRCPDFEPSKSRGSIATSYQMLTRARLLSMGRVGFRSEESRPKEWFQGHWSHNERSSFCRLLLRKFLTNSGGVFRIHRADFQRCLLDHLPLPSNKTVPKNSSCALHLSHRLIDYTTSSISSSSPGASCTLTGPITLYFSDQPPRTCDILVGADGIKSTVRKLFLSRLPNPEGYTKCMNPVWSGAIAYRGLIDKAKLENAHPRHRALGHPGLLVRPN